MEKTFQILAVVLIGVAAFFLWKGNTDGLFVSAVLGSVCFFLSVRFQIKARMERRAEAAETETGEEIIEEKNNLNNKETENGN